MRILVVYWKGSDRMAWTLEEAISYYKKQGAPRDQSMLIALLKEVQQENGGSISQSRLQVISQELAVGESFLLALIKRIPGLRVADTHCLELCVGPNCGKHRALADFAEGLCKEQEGRVALKYAPCMRMCGKGPNIKWDGVLYHNATQALIERLVKGL